MRSTRDNLADRRSAAAAANAAVLQAYNAAKEAREPTRIARQEERLALAVAGHEQRAERKMAKLAEQERARLQVLATERQAAADASADAAAAAVVEARLKAENRISRVIEDEAARKAERDRRYASRRARQR